MTESNNSQTRCGFVSVIGCPNAGKSTLVNALVGTKVSIVSKKVQTTRARVLGIFTEGATQVLLIDTPGIFEPKKTMERAMVQAAYEGLESGDIILHLVDTSARDPLAQNEDILKRLAQRKNVLLALNKTDAVSKPDLLALAEAFNARHDYDATFMISGLKGRGLDQLRGWLAAHLPAGPWHYGEDEITDMPMRLLAAEITREKIFKQLHDELPYAAHVETEVWENFADGSYKISQLVYVQRDSQKAIVLGRGGQQIKRIGEAARKELESLFGVRVHLKLFVKVQENWSERADIFEAMGLQKPL